MNGASQETQGPKKRPRSLFRALLFWTVLLGGLFMVFFGPFLSQVVTSIYRADEGFKRAQRTINPEELRNWALQAIKNHSGANNPEIKRSEIPSYVRNLYPEQPEYAVAISGDWRQPHVAIMWGGGFFAWGIEIGDTNFSESYVSENPERPHYYQWTNGIYFAR